MEIPNGKYRGKARTPNATLIESSQGTPGVSVEMVFTAGDLAQAGASLTWTGWLTDGAYERTVESLRTMGWTGVDIDQVQDLDKNEVELVIEAEEYNGNWYPRIKFINKIGGAMGAAMPTEKARTFAAAMRERIRALDAANGKGPARAERRAPAQQSNRAAAAGFGGRGAQGGDFRDVPPPGDDDIPF